MKSRITFFFCVLISLFSNTKTWACSEQLSFTEMTQTADLIFIGEVYSMESAFNEQRNMIFTQVTFVQNEVIFSNEKSVQRLKRTIVITYAGGDAEGKRMRVCGMPKFEIGQRYLLFAQDDGKRYFNPIVGESQGFFKVVRDKRLQTDYILTASGHAITSLSIENLTVSKPVQFIENGKATFKNLELFSARQSPSVPESASGNGRAYLSSKKETNDSGFVTLEAFIDFVLQKALYENTKKQSSSFGSKLKNENQGTSFQSSFPEILSPAVAQPQNPSGDSRSSSETNYTSSYDLAACSVHDLPIVMQQTMPDSFDYETNFEAMAIWNQYLPIYQWIPSDGPVEMGDYYNGVNEFAGRMDDVGVALVYGATWGSSAIALHKFDNGPDYCSDRFESDVIWNANRKWTTDLEDLLVDPDLILLLPTAMHELGHVWGLMSADEPETYTHQVLTVMHAFNDDIIEDGQGIHSTDAWILRRHYLDQMIYPPIADVGIESYYANSSGKLRSSKTQNALLEEETSFKSGESITLENITIENIGTFDIHNLKMQIYFSEDRTITSEDHLVEEFIWTEGNWEYGSFEAESFFTHSYGFAIPEGIPSGDYFVGLIVSIDEFEDAFSGNDTTTFFNPITLDILPNLTTAGSESFSTPSTTSVTISANIQNNGIADAGSFEVQYYASVDDEITASDILLDADTYAGLGAGVTTSIYTSINYDIYMACESHGDPVLIPGDYYIGFILDEPNDVKELDEIDNAISISTGLLTVPGFETNYHRAYNLPNPDFHNVHTQEIEVVQNAEDNTAFITTGWHSPDEINDVPITRDVMQIISLDENKNPLRATTYLLNGTTDNLSDMRSYDIKELGIGNNTDTGYITCGESIVSYSGNGEPNNFHAYIMKVDDEGAVVWMKTYFPGTSSRLKSIVPAIAGDGYLACGAYVTDDFRIKAFLLRVDNDGNVLWSSTIEDTHSGDASYSEYNQIIADLTGNMPVPTYYLAGSCNMEYFDCDNSSEVLFTRIDEVPVTPVFNSSSYAVEGGALNNGNRTQYGNSITLGPESQLYIGATYQVDYTNHAGNCISAPVDLLLLNISNTGAIRWTKRYNVSGKNYTKEILHVRGLNEVVITGNSGDDSFMMSTDLDGNPLRLEQIYDSEATPNEGRSLARNPYNGRYMFVGSAQILSPDYEDMFLFERNPLPAGDLDRCCDVIVDSPVQSRTQKSTSRQHEMLETGLGFVEIEALDVLIENTLKCGNNDPSCAIYDYGIAMGACDDNGTSTNSNDDFYTVDITIYYSNEPTLCELILTDESVTILASTTTYGSGSHTFTDIEIPANGESFEISAFFDCEPGCALNMVLPPAYPCSCGAPLDSWVTKITSSSAKIHWSPIDGVTKYRLFFRKAGSSEPWKNRYSTNSWRTITLLDANTEYEYKLKAKCSDGWSDWSPRYYFTTYSSLFGGAEARDSDDTESELDGAIDLIIYPNPTDGLLNLHISNAQPNSVVEIYSILGETMYSMNVMEQTNELTLDLSGMSAGTYFIRMDNGQKSIIRKFVLIKK